ncbi:guanine nucleotide-binding protein G(i) subunit alpha [Acrasis kona]|uniref:Guanine nucleotide-binding protein G(I) subunit alpha n=1 Tax=Acrasis kona TaxID=1008807 RepID=A0AAW2YT90_9EUKA
MLCGGSNEREKPIEAEMAKKNQAIRRDIKILLLGAGESGKSTVFKQLRIMNKLGFSLEERSGYREIVFSNVVKAMKTLVTACISMEIAIDDDCCPCADRINSVNNEALGNIMEVWNEQMVSDIALLWRNAGIQKAFERRNEFQLEDSAPYYFNEIERIGSENYIPNEQDVLRTRVKTTGIAETFIKMNGQVLKFFDVGGQRNERKKWIHCFEGVTAVIFVASISEFDQKCYEDDHTNRMMEALLLFDEICNSRWFCETSVILFLNKVDLFRDKIKTHDLRLLFKDYQGGNNFESAVDYIKDQFVNKNRRKDSKQIFSHLTCATDTNQIQRVFDSIKDIILQRNLLSNGVS